MKKLVFFIVSSLFLINWNLFAKDNFDKALQAFNQKNYSLAVKLFEEDCKNDIAKSCFALGAMYEEGAGVEKDYKKAAKYYEKACNLNDGDSCNRLGVMYVEGKGVEKNYKKATKYYEKACKLNNKYGCSNLGGMYDRGKGVEKDYKKAAKYYEKACNLNEKLACTNLGLMYVKGEGVEKNYKNVIKYFEKACELNDGGGCNNLGVMYEGGLGVEKDYKKAVKYYEKACNLNNGKGCKNYERLKNLVNIPKPFGLILGFTTVDEFLSVVKKKNWVITKEGNRIIKDDISNPNVYGYFVENIKLKNLSNAKFWFYKGRLMEITYILYEDMGKNTFKSYYDKLKAKYGNPVKYIEPYLAEGYAEWDFGNIKIKLRVPWVSRYTYLTYEEENLVKEADRDDEKYYQSVIQKTSKDIEGL